MNRKKNNARIRRPACGHHTKRKIVFEIRESGLTHDRRGGRNGAPLFLLCMQPGSTKKMVEHIVAAGSIIAADPAAGEIPGRFRSLLNLFVSHRIEWA
ncbi:MAG: hypothetical protein ACOY90_00015 [Candidatus Zhuqueibacterota bacterium]